MVIYFIRVNRTNKVSLSRFQKQQQRLRVSELWFDSYLKHECFKNGGRSDI